MIRSFRYLFNLCWKVLYLKFLVCKSLFTSFFNFFYLLLFRLCQVSLWQGGATFNNVNLNLEAIEEELQLPLHLISGHIHELKISVPWTKLTSEPIVVYINTIGTPWDFVKVNNLSIVQIIDSIFIFI